MECLVSKLDARMPIHDMVQTHNWELAPPGRKTTLP